ncbi:Transposase [Caligus rogercresseyi]|uniref:Transposase n=1 Tax=Caligus rogercresseyi TaxID=217165 RepID=A0A7T8KDD4_CALRO|nr:Transposase [Caligus rogercresseyi]
METPDFRSYFLIRIKLARAVYEIHGDLLSTFPDSCPGLSTLQRWHTEFDRGVFAMEKKTRPVRPRETRSEENVARVEHLVEDNPRMTTRQVAAELSLPSTTVFRLLTEDLGLRNLLSVLVPHQLSEANKTQRVKCCQDLLKLFQDHGEDFSGVSSVSAGRVLVLLGFGGAEASLGGAHGGPVIDPPYETESEEDDNSDGVSITALPARTTTDRNTMIEYLRTTGKRFLSLKKDKIRLKDCLLMLDNAPPDPEGRVTGETVPVPEVEAPAPGGRVWGHEKATLAVHRAMRRVSEDELYDQLRKLQGHCHDVIAVRGDYVY